MIKNRPGILNWSEFVNSTPIHSIWNTPPVFQIYMTNTILSTVYKNRFNNNIYEVEKWVKQRAESVYEIIDFYDNFYINKVNKQHRSRMNIPFRICNDVELEKQFTDIAREEYELEQLMGHHLFGGQRITTYTSVPDDAIEAVKLYMIHFAKTNIKAN